MSTLFISVIIFAIICYTGPFLIWCLVFLFRIFLLFIMIPSARVGHSRRSEQDRMFEQKRRMQQGTVAKQK